MYFCFKCVKLTILNIEIDIKMFLEDTQFRQLYTFQYKQKSSEEKNLQANILHICV